MQHTINNPYSNMEHPNGGSNTETVVSVIIVSFFTLLNEAAGWFHYNINGTGFGATLLRTAITAVVGSTIAFFVSYFWKKIFKQKP